MAGLKDYSLEAQQQGQAGQQQPRSAGQFISQGTTWAQPFRQPLAGVVGDEPVLILQVGDKPGASDVLLCIDRSGSIATVKAEHARITAIPVQGGTYMPLENALATARSSSRL